MSEAKKVPPLRFKGFDGGWEKKRLGDIGSPYNGLSGKCKSDFGHGNGRYVTYLNVFDNPVAHPDECDKIEVDKSQNEVCNGDVFFTTSSETPEEVGMTSVWDGDGCNTYLNSFCFGYRPRVKIETDFWAYMLRSDSFRERIVILAQGISRYNISKRKVMELPVFLPGETEQRKLGELCRSLEVLIASRETALEKLKMLKKAMLEKMFPRANAKVPEVRFKGFDGEWRSYEFSEVYERINAKSSQVQSSEYLQTGDFPVVDQGKDLIIAYSNNKDKVFRAAESPVIVFGDHTREVKFVDFDFVIGADGTQLLRSANFDVRFAYYVMKRVTLPNMGYSRHFKFLLETRYSFPSLPEQRKIGAYFRSLDALISARRDEIAKLKDLKKALLDRMFV